MSFPKTLPKVLAFLHQAEGLKTLLRHSWLSNHRQESVAEHTWRMALMAILLAPELGEKVDLQQVLKMIAVHDLAEITAGDHHAWKGKLKDKHLIEQKALHELMKSLPAHQANEIETLWHQFEAADTPEARFAQAMDKLEVLIQHNEAPLSTWNEKEMTFNLIYGDGVVAYNQMLTLFKDLVRNESKKKLKDKSLE